jgi:hypothetical protein
VIREEISIGELAEVGQKITQGFLAIYNPTEALLALHVAVAEALAAMPDAGEQRRLAKAFGESVLDNARFRQRRLGIEPEPRDNVVPLRELKR